MLTPQENPTPESHSSPKDSEAFSVEGFFGAVIISYTRAQALADGVFVDVTELAHETGFRLPVAVTAAVWADIEDIPPQSGQDTTGRLWDLLTSTHFHTCRAVAEGNGDTDTIRLSFVLHRDGCHPRYEIKSVIGPGDNGEPVLTIMKPNED